MLLGAWASATHCTTWPSAPLTSSVSKQWGLDQSHVFTTPFSVTVVSDKSVEPVWCAMTGTGARSPIVALKTMTSLFLIRLRLLAARGIAIGLVVGVGFIG